ALWLLNELDAALVAYRAALSLKPDLAEAWSRIGNILKQQGRVDAAEAAYRQAIAINPHLAEAQNNLGLVLYATGRVDAAMDAYHAAINGNPGLCEAHVNLGNVLKEREQYDDAIACYRAALTIDAANVEAHCNLGTAYMVQDLLHEAIDSYRAALALDPNFFDAHYNLGIALCVLGKLRESVAAYDRALAIRPDFAQAHYNSSYPRLLLGDLVQGFKSYEWRWRGGSKKFVKRECEKPMLADAEIAGRTVLLYAEQGVGDTIQFSRYAALVAAAGGRVILEVPQYLHRLFSCLQGVSALIAPGEPAPAFDAYCPLMSLPSIFSTVVETIPANSAYLSAEDSISESWRTKLGSHGFKIGIAWQGNPNATAEKGRSAPLASFAPLARIPGVRLISLQKTHGLDQLQSLPADMIVETLGDDFDSGSDAFVDTAAVMMNLDLIITVDTSIGHLAGALGRPAWIALQMIPHWVWMLDRSDTPWYPSLRLFRQSTRGDWSGLFAAMAEEIRTIIDAKI
ncbi:MAG TPA: tetratricopeptide repeat protein, partial [Burkholderiaceae bacterium]